VALCKIGKVGMNRAKNICRHSSRKTDVIDVALTAAVTLEDCQMNTLAYKIPLAKELAIMVSWRGL
jgi:hypothetical protein